MTSTGSSRLLPMRDRQALLERRRQLADATAAIDAEQQRLVAEFIRLHRELEHLREVLWPSEEGHAFRKSRRPGPGGPDIIPPPVAGAVPLRGRALRDAALRILLHAEGAHTLGEIHCALHLAGNVLLAPDPVKQLGDALGYEERRDTVRRVARGTYAIGTLTPYRRRTLQRS